jgi:hypothetical protein
MVYNFIISITQRFSQRTSSSSNNPLLENSPKNLRKKNPEKEKKKVIRYRHTKKKWLD